MLPNNRLKLTVALPFTREAPLLSAASRKYGIVSGRCPGAFPFPVSGPRGRLPLRYACDLRALAAIPLDAIYGGEESTLDSNLIKLQIKSLPPEEW